MSNKEKWMLVFHTRGVVLSLCLAIIIYLALWLIGVTANVIFTLFIPFAVIYLIYMYVDRSILIKYPQLVVMTQEEKTTLGFKIDTIVMIVAFIGILVCLFYLKNFFNIVLMAFAIYYIASSVIYTIGIFRNR